MNRPLTSEALLEMLSRTARGLAGTGLDAKAPTAPSELTEAVRALIEERDIAVAERDGVRQENAERRHEAATWLRTTKKLTAERDRLQDILGFATPYPALDVLRILADAADHLLDVHNCDNHGYEVVNAAARAARDIVAKAETPLAREMLRSEAPWVVCVPPAKAPANILHIRCDRCSATREVLLPLDASMVLVLLAWFQRQHATCKEGVERG